MRKLSRVLSILLVLCMVLAMLPTAFATDEPLTTEVVAIEKYGNLDLKLKGSELLASGFSYGDVITVEMNGAAYDMPVGTNYSDVDNGNLICRVVIDEANDKDYIVLAINMGDLATTAGIATKTKIEEDPGYRWDYNEGVTTPVEVKITLKEAGGYYDEWLMRQLTRTNAREDYSDLSDAEFANFRVISTTGMGENILYRSSSPVNPELGRNTYADAAMQAAGVKTVMNLADNEAGMKAYEGYDDSYYSTANVIPLNLGVDFTAAEFKAGLKEGFLFIASNEGPYLIHCNEGKDRAGFVSALLECLMGATADEVIADYMVTYYNYYGVQPDTEQYQAIAKSNIMKSLATAFGVADITAADVDLAAETEAFLAEEVGMTAEEIDALKDALGGDASYENTFSGTVIEDGKDMLKYGHIDIDIPADEVLKAYEYGDIVEVTLEGYGTFEVPVCASYDDVATGEMLLRVVSGKDYVILAINYGQIAVQEGIVELAPEGSETTYQVCEGVTFPINVTIAPKQLAQFKSVIIPDGADMLKYGHLDIDINADEFLAEIPLDTQVTIEIEGYGTYEHIPVCASYDDVASGSMLLRAVSGKTYLIFAINYGQIAVQEGIVDLAPEGSATTYQVCEDVTFPINVTITEEDGKVENVLSNLIRTDVRSDYADLTDAQFANFREISIGNILPGTLYRSSSPINPEIGRNTYADAAAAEAGVKTFINLADNEAEATAYPGYAESYYSAQNHIFLGLPVAFTTDTFKSGLAEGLRYIINNEGPYLVHCTEGKDRAGLTAAILECLCGATYEEVLDDYVETYRNYYSVEEGTHRALTEKELTAIEGVIIDNLKLAFGVEINETTDLAEAATAYLKDIGLTDEEIEALKDALCNKEAPYENQFTDVKEGAWYADAVEYVYVNGLMDGMTSTTFEPGTKMTRAMLVTVLWRNEGKPVGYQNPFEDVPDGKFYTNAVAWAAENDIVNGVGNGKFNPNGLATREQLVTILYRYVNAKLLDVSETADLSQFPDGSKVSKYAKTAMTWAVGSGLIQGSKEGGQTLLLPQGSATRAQSAMMLMRLLTKYPVNDELTMEDYLEKTDYEWFATGKTDYTIQGMMVSADREVYNYLEDVYYTAQPNGIDVILKGTSDEEWVTKLSKVITTYTKADGTALTAEDFVPDTWITLKTIPTTGNFACFVPVTVKLTVNTAWGDVLHVNRSGVPHGAGDYLVCAVGEDGKPDLTDVWVVNGLSFVNNYDMTNAK